MELLKDIIASIGDWLKNRAVNPFLATFIFAWGSLNWRVVLVLFSSDHYEKKISAIDRYLDATSIGRYGAIVILPTFFALLYVLVGPFVFGLLTTYHRRRTNALKLKLMRVDRDRPLSREDANRIVEQRAQLKVALSRLEEEKGKVELEQASLIAVQVEKIKQLEASISSLRKSEKALNEAFVSQSLSSNASTFDLLMNPPSANTLKNELAKYSPIDVSRQEFPSSDVNEEHNLSTKIFSSEEVTVLMALHQEDGDPVDREHIRQSMGLTRLKMNIIVSSLVDLGIVEVEEGKLLLTPLGCEVVEFVSTQVSKMHG